MLKSRLWDRDVVMTVFTSDEAILRQLFWRPLFQFRGEPLSRILRPETADRDAAFKAVDEDLLGVAVLRQSGFHNEVVTVLAGESLTKVYALLSHCSQSLSR